MSGEKDLQTVQSNLPATIEELMSQVQFIQEIMRKVMVEGEHFGTIPGCGPKPALLKPGAEKLGFVFRLQPTFNVESIDYAEGHREYRVTCRLSNGTEGVGSCSTLESKYRYRNASRVCPKCSKETIIKGKEEYGGGWLCFSKKGGCGEKWPLGAEEIESQVVGKVENDNPADFYNTCLKMAKKRAHVDAILTATAASDIFAQDIEEMAEAVVTVPPATPETKEPAKPEPEAEPASESEFSHTLDKMLALCKIMSGGDNKEAEKMLLEASAFPNAQGKTVVAKSFAQLSKSQKWTSTTYGKIKKMYEAWMKNTKPEFVPEDSQGNPKEETVPF